MREKEASITGKRVQSWWDDQLHLTQHEQYQNLEEFRWLPGVLFYTQWWNVPLHQVLVSFHIKMGLVILPIPTVILVKSMQSFQIFAIASPGKQTVIKSQRLQSYLHLEWTAYQISKPLGKEETLDPRHCVPLPN